MGTRGRTLRVAGFAGDGGPESALVAIVGSPQETNLELAAAWQSQGFPAALLSPRDAPLMLHEGDVAVGRLDVLPTLDGIEAGIEALDELERRGVHVLNRRRALFAAHDKLATARRLLTARVPHPKTVLLPHVDAPRGLRPPLVLKPRFGSWGRDVFLCETERSLEATLHEVRGRPWFIRHGAILQELVPSFGRDLRVLVAGGRVVGAVERVAKPGEWRTNISLGGSRVPAVPSPAAESLALAAAAAIDADLVGVDLIPIDDGHVVLELNGAVEFDRTYDFPGEDVYWAAADALGLPRSVRVAV